MPAISDNETKASFWRVIIPILVIVSFFNFRISNLKRRKPLMFSPWDMNHDIRLNGLVYSLAKYRAVLKILIF
jgi:hypothetical protein